jgi:hypothetical protein
MDMKLQMSHLGPGKSTIVVAEQEKANMTEMTFDFALAVAVMVVVVEM